MNAPEPQALPRLVALARIHPSPTNPRKRHDPAKHAELVASVKALGVLQPLLCRPLPIDRGPGSLTIAEKFDHFELVAGELGVYSFGTPDKPERLLAAAAREGIDAAAIKAAVIKESRDKAKAKTKPAKAPRSGATASKRAPNPAPSPLPAAQANDIGATPAAPADEPAKPRRKAAQAKADPAPAAPGNAPATPAKPARRDLADGMIYCHPDDRTLTWTGKGKEPAWVRERFSRGLGLDVRDIHEAPPKVMGDWPFPVEGSRA